MSISAMIRCNNEDDFLKESIGSICNFADEIVFINNKCTDNSVEIAKQFKIKIVNFNYNVGGDVSLTDYTNWCAEQTKGDYILKWDAYMIACDNFPNMIKDNLEKNTKVIWYPLLNFYGDHKHIVKNRKIRFSEPYFFHRKLTHKEHILGHEIFWHPNEENKYITADEGSGTWKLLMKNKKNSLTHFKNPFALHFNIKSTMKYLLRKQMNIYMKKKLKKISLLEWFKIKFKQNWVKELNNTELNILNKVTLYNGFYPDILNDYIKNPKYKIIYLDGHPRLRVTKENFKYFL